LSSGYKHVGEFTRRFKKALKALSSETKERLHEKIDELLKGHIVGKSLKGPYKEFKVIRVGKFRLVYNDKEPCVILFYDVGPRESIYEELS
jgi:mRNA-degrading endonuclease RelE of RelBE toxin-antitoxin system